MKRWTKEEVLLLKDNYETVSLERLHTLFPAVTSKQLWSKAQALGLRRIFYWANRQKSVIDFSEIDTQEKAYWLGFIAADGCVTGRSERPNLLQFRMKLSTRDLNHLEKLRDLLCPNSTIKCRKINPNTKKGFSPEGASYCALVLSDTEFCKQLIKHGIVRRKSRCLSCPKTVPGYLVSHWIRGYIDGDGYISKTKQGLRIGADGTSDVLDFINKAFYDFFVHGCSIYSRDGKHYEIAYTGKTAVKFSEFIYEGATTLLERKHNIVKGYMEEKNGKV